MASYPAAFVLAFQPVAFLGAGVWLETESAQPMINLIGMVVSVSLFILFRKSARPIWHNAVAVSLVSSFLFVPFGLYAVIPSVAYLAYYVMKAVDESRAKRIASAMASAALTAGVFMLLLNIAWDDANPYAAFAKSHAFRFRWNSHVAIQHQLEQEYAINTGDFKKVLQIADEQLTHKIPALRMSVAYRILAQYRLGHLPDGLFKYPMPASHVGTDAEELKMDGYVLLFNYGFIQPAYREIYEIVSVRGWQPVHFRILGDISAINGEYQLAKKYYSQLARCPFHGAFARKRLEGIAKSDVNAFADIADIGTMHETWKNFFDGSGIMFFSTDDNLEEFIYDHYRSIRKAPEFMVRMFVSSALLRGDCKILLDNTAILDTLCADAGRDGRTIPPSERPWPVPVQEAVLFHLNSVSGEKKNELIAKIRKFAITEEVAENYNLFCSVPHQISLNSPFSTTYFFYKAFLLPAKNAEKPADAKGGEK